MSNVISQSNFRGLHFQIIMFDLRCFHASIAFSADEKCPPLPGTEGLNCGVISRDHLIAQMWVQPPGTTQRLSSLESMDVYPMGPSTWTSKAILGCSIARAKKQNRIVGMSHESHYCISDFLMCNEWRNGTHPNLMIYNYMGIHKQACLTQLRGALELITQCSERNCPSYPPTRTLSGCTASKFMTFDIWYLPTSWWGMSTRKHNWVKTEWNLNKNMDKRITCGS